MSGPADLPGDAAAHAPAPIRVLVVDDEVLVRSGFAMILSVEPDLAVVGQAANGLEALRRVEELAPDVVLMDVRMPGLDGVAATERLLARHPATRVLILTTFDDDEYLFAALRAGASGFLLKNCPPDDLVSAIRLAAEGHALLAPEVTQRVIRRSTVESGADLDPRLAAGLAELTERELEVLRLLADGRSNAEIADDLVVSTATVKTHVSRVLTKLGARDRVQAVIAAHRAGLMRD